MPVSRRHCQLNRDQGVLKVRDLGSRNGTYVNGRRIEQEAVVQAGDQVKVGPVTFVLRIDGQPEHIEQPEAGVEEAPQEDGVRDDSTADEFDSFADLDFEPLEEDDSD
jgi:pSer/pThr/pTyr-binding forkhead associated (FHA) protein